MSMEVAESIPAEPMQLGDTLNDLDDILSTADNLADALDFNPCKSNNAPEPTSERPINGDVEISDINVEKQQNGEVVMVSEDEDHLCLSDTVQDLEDKKTEAASSAEADIAIAEHEANEDIENKNLENGPSEKVSDIADSNPNEKILNGEEEHIDEVSKSASPEQQSREYEVEEKQEIPIEIIDLDSDDGGGKDDISNDNLHEPPLKSEHNEDSEVAHVEEKIADTLNTAHEDLDPEITLLNECQNIKEEMQEAPSESKTSVASPHPMDNNGDEVFCISPDADENHQDNKMDTDSDIEMIDLVPASSVKQESNEPTQEQSIDAENETIANEEVTHEQHKSFEVDGVEFVNAESSKDEKQPIEITDKCDPPPKVNNVVKSLPTDEIVTDCMSKEEIEVLSSPKSDQNLEPADQAPASKAESASPPKQENEQESIENISNEVELSPCLSPDADEAVCEKDSDELLEVTTDETPMEIEAPAIIENTDKNEVETLMEVDTTDNNTTPFSPGIIELSDDDDIRDKEDDIEDDEKNIDEDYSKSQPHCSSSVIKEEETNESSEKMASADSKSLPMELSDTKCELKSDTKVEEKIESLSSSDDEEYLYYDMDCINFECPRDAKKFYKAPLFTLNFYKMQKKTSKTLFVCNSCFDNSVKKIGMLATALEAHEPLLKQEIPKRQDFVEILDSSDEEGDDETEQGKGEKELDPESVDLISQELDNTIENIIKRVNAKQQVMWAKSILSEKLSKMEVECQEITENLAKLQNSADNMHTALYQCPKIKIKELPPLDLNTGRQYGTEPESNLPPLGELKYPPIEVNGNYYAVRNKAIASWLPCRVIDSMDVVISGQKTVKYYKVKYLRIKVPTVKCVSAKHMAYGEAPSVRLSIGTRVIALFDGSTLSKHNKESIAPNAFYPGVVAEQLQLYNKYRYLIFFDDGYAQYVQHKDVRIVCQVADNVWEDVHPASREFIHNYLSQYQRHRPMVQVKKGQSMITESNGKWLYAKVVDVDASLVQMQFDGQNRYEWIYRGSTRLGPLFKEKQSNGTASAPASIPRRSEPYVRYDEETTRNDTAQPSDEGQQNLEKQTATRAVAKKSTARPDSQQPPSPSSSQPVVKHLNNSVIFLEDDNRPKGKVVYYTAKKNLPPKAFSPHDCKPNCLYTITHNLHCYSPLAKPLLSGWERQIFKSKLKKSVVYRTPCGRRIRNMEELHRYLRLTKNVLNVDNFDFDCAIHCLAEYVIDSSIVSKADLSNGIENMVIPCVNYYDNTMPPYCEYSLERIPTEGVNMNLDPNFLVGCDCEDDCLDKSKCSCWQLTMSGARFGNPNTPPENVGYWFKRLLDPVPTGIYECNVNCKCSKNCLNRVVQNPLQVKLQVFKTSNRGWGLRCLNDISKGTFICIYAGHLLTEQKANEGGVNASDEYFAELDYIEVVERLKEGYESDVQDDNESEDEEIEEPNPDADSDEDFRSKCNVNNKDASINTRLRTRRGTSDEDKSISKKGRVVGVEDSQERQVISFEPNTSLGNEEQTTANTKYRSIRKYFGKNEFCYIMDAKKTGNIGRYFNHSCSPNLFVQNVFVDTQDLRFPWVAFFALSHIRAGTELTWNYNYEVGIVPGKVLYCECGAPNCRGRLL